MIPSLEISIALELFGVLVPATAKAFLDLWYDCPTEAWLRDVFPDQLKKHLESPEVGLVHAIDPPENSDCDDFAIESWVCARRRHRKTNRRKVGFAFGVFAYEREDTLRGHILNVAMICDGFKPNGRAILRPVFFEPMGERRIVLLTGNELLTCTNYWF